MQFMAVGFDKESKITEVNHFVQEADAVEFARRIVKAGNTIVSQVWDNDGDANVVKTFTATPDRQKALGA